MERDELAAWLRLLETPGIGNGSARELLAAFGSPQAVFDASETELAAHVSSSLRRGLAQAPETLDALVETTWAWLQADPTRRVVTLGDTEYPRQLLETADPPLLLYAHGRIELLQATSVAVVGSRNPTPQGKDNARDFAAQLSLGGITIVSGLALGIDGAAHEGALQGPGSTIAVVGTGLDRVYPSPHRALAHRIAESGLLLSEYSLGTPPLPNNFPRRNRIISGLARGTLVVEATLKSGSLITARLAAEQGREVFAIPGSIHSPQARGCHVLIKQGAKLVDDAEDILEELQWGHAQEESSSTTVSPGLAPMPDERDSDDPVLAALGYDPIALDTLVARTGWSVAELSARLLELELEGLVARLPGGIFQRLARG